MIPAFDGHNDTLLRLLEFPDRPFVERAAEGHLDLPRAREGGLAGGLFAMWAPDRRERPPAVDADVDAVAPYGPIDPDDALRVTLRMFALLRRLDDAGSLRIATSADEVERAMADGVLAAVPHIEGAEAIPTDLDALSLLHALGLRSLGLTWSRPNAHALCPSPRNLTDAQLDALAERDGLVGLNFAVGFLREDGRDDPDTPLETLVRHLDHLVDRLGEDRVALGSDFDGATMPRELADAAGLPHLLGALRRHGWSEALLHKVAHRNWLSLLDRVQAS